jgi:nicotinamidase-related amidase
MTPLTLAQADLSQLVVIDVQERLAAAMPQEGVSRLVRNCNILLQAAQLLSVPTIVTEQYPKGLGPTVPELSTWIPADGAVEKRCFSCCESIEFQARCDANRPQVILAGMEAHICVLQTALQLQAQGKTVFVAEDAVLSRNPDYLTNAMQRLTQAGVIVSNTESYRVRMAQDCRGRGLQGH